MYSDRELLELAAKAAGIEGEWNENYGKSGMIMLRNPATYRLGFDPLTNDGDALRLAVKLNIHIRLWQYAVEAEDNDGRSTGMIHARECSGDMEATTRRAIVRAAAAIGEAMQ